MSTFDDAFRRDIEPVSGGWRAVNSTARRKIAGLVRGSRNFWIGIASNGVDGVRARWNAKYKGLGMDSIAIVYETTSDSFRKNIEDDLIEFFEDSCDNKVAGGGGGYGSAPYAVYVAWR
jgi:hypothetical protein